MGSRGSRYESRETPALTALVSGTPLGWRCLEQLLEQDEGCCAHAGQWATDTTRQREELERPQAGSPGAQGSQMLSNAEGGTQVPHAPTPTTWEQPVPTACAGGRSDNQPLPLWQIWG